MNHLQLTIATRESRLALWQAQFVQSLLQAQGHTVELLGMTTQGDQILDRSLSKVGGKGLFVKELETALDRIFDEGRAFGYLSQIPKGQQTIDKLIANPDLVISSKKTGEDLTATQWKEKLIREQDNITMMAKAMSTLAKCALKQAP